MPSSETLVITNLTRSLITLGGGRTISPSGSLSSITVADLMAARIAPAGKKTSLSEDLVTHLTAGRISVTAYGAPLSAAGLSNLIEPELVAFGTSAPSDPGLGDFWKDTTLNYLKQYDGTEWVVVADLNQTAVEAGSGVTMVEIPGIGRKLSFTFTAQTITLTDEAGVVAYGGMKIGDLPAGAILFLGAVANLAVTKSSAGVNSTWNGDFSLGTATASNNATLSSAEADYIPSTATPAASAGATTAKGQTTTALAGVVFDGTATAKDIFLNFLVDDADHNVGATPCNLIVNGSIDFLFANLGDY